MQIESISYQRVKNLGNYESERFEASANVVEGEDPHTAFIALKRYVEANLGIKQEPHAPYDDEF
jgi:hypothetical protein